MKLMVLSEIKFEKFSQTHSMSSFQQTSEWAILKAKNDWK